AQPQRVDEVHHRESVGVPQRELRSAAVQVIARLYAWRVGDLAADITVGDALVTALNDREPAIRMTAINAIGALRYDRGVQALTDLYTHYGRGSMAVAALEGLARIAHPASLPLFVAGLSGRDVSLRLAAVEGLARNGATDQRGAIDALMLNERNPELLLAGHFAAVLLSNGPVDELVGGLERSRLRPKALQYLEDVAPGRGNVLGPHVQDPDVSIRFELIEVLGRSGDPQALSVVQRMQQDTDPAVARAAVRAAARLQGVDALNP
ncbi:MAG: HEAT repeat domain-containing protein, partial [Vicinamibacterales bacterium]